LVASAFSVACAIFLILELDHPFVTSVPKRRRGLRMKKAAIAEG
jgi:hypothetical protein